MIEDDAIGDAAAVAAERMAGSTSGSARARQTGPRWDRSGMMATAGTGMLLHMESVQTFPCDRYLVPAVPVTYRRRL